MNLTTKHILLFIFLQIASHTLFAQQINVVPQEPLVSKENSVSRFSFSYAEKPQRLLQYNANAVRIWDLGAERILSTYYHEKITNAKLHPSGESYLMAKVPTYQRVFRPHQKAQRRSKGIIEVHLTANDSLLFTVEGYAAKFVDSTTTIVYKKRVSSQGSKEQIWLCSAEGGQQLIFDPKQDTKIEEFMFNAEDSLLLLSVKYPNQTCAMLAYDLSKRECTSIVAIDCQEPRERYQKWGVSKSPEVIDLANKWRITCNLLDDHQADLNPSDFCSSITFTARLSTGRFRMMVTVQDMASGTSKDIAQSEYLYTAIAGNEANSRVATVDRQLNFKIWDVNSDSVVHHINVRDFFIGKQARYALKDFEGVNQLYFDEERRRLVFGVPRLKSLFIWYYETNQVKQIKSPLIPVRFAEFMNDSVLIIQRASHLEKFDVSSGEVLGVTPEIETRNSFFVAKLMRPQGLVLTFRQADSIINVWSLDSMRLVQKIELDFPVFMAWADTIHGRIVYARSPLISNGKARDGALSERDIIRNLAEYYLFGAGMNLFRRFIDVEKMRKELCRCDFADQVQDILNRTEDVNNSTVYVHELDSNGKFKLERTFTVPYLGVDNISFLPNVKRDQMLMNLINDKLVFGWGGEDQVGTEFHYYDFSADELKLLAENQDWMYQFDTKGKLVLTSTNTSVFLKKAKGNKVVKQLNLADCGIEKEEIIEAELVHDTLVTFYTINHFVTWNVVNDSVTVEKASVNDFAYSPNGKFLVRCNKSLELWDLESSKKLFDRYLHDNVNSDILISPAMHYWARGRGYEAVAFEVGRNAYHFEQFDLVYHRPDLVLQCFPGYDTAQAAKYQKAVLQRNAYYGVDEHTKAQLSENIPTVSLMANEGRNFIVDERAYQLQIQASSKSSVRRLHIIVNGVPEFGLLGKELPSSQVFESSHELQLSAGMNKIQVFVENELGLRSLTETLIVEYRAQANPKFYFVGIGFSDYAHFPDLNFGAHEVQHLDSVIQAASPSHQRLIISNHNAANGERVVQLIDSFLATATVDDAVMFYLSGHGVVHNDNYLFVLPQAHQHHLDSSSISYQQLEACMLRCKSRNQLMILNSCYSGELMSPKTVDERDLFPTVRELFQQTNYNTGATVFASAEGFSENTVMQNGGITMSPMAKGLLSALLNLRNPTLRQFCAYLTKVVKEESVLSRTVPHVRQYNHHNDYHLWYLKGQ